MEQNNFNALNHKNIRAFVAKEHAVSHLPSESSCSPSFLFFRLKYR